MATPAKLCDEARSTCAYSYTTAGCHPTSTSEIDKYPGGADKYFADLEAFIESDIGPDGSKLPESRTPETFEKYAERLAIEASELKLRIDKEQREARRLSNNQAERSSPRATEPD
ncbi:hypothetical protein A1Q2_05862 [Trichosporon asahii var. asahii CBS 8904]|uniref:Uncharacterized protein n=1 Tax=Trichosporon asahii var. asahii (strain CBS 8904) TaxID=1220162 RepID=K1VT81_TRIAC|nr:hypothetical protein A1Q2_05862 [Trichosporon asahii var. asahii CBS 8904]